MKVELDDITLGHSPLTDHIFAGIQNPREKNMVWKHKKNVTNEFIGCVISRWENQSEVIASGKNEWEITVKKIK